MKQLVKKILLKRLHARPEIVSRVATRVVRDGVPRVEGWVFAEERRSTLAYLAQMQIDGPRFKFCASGAAHSLYSSVYAAMLLSLLDAKEVRPFPTDSQWIAHFDAHQDPADGYFRDPALAGDEFETPGDWGDGWGKMHLAAHLIIAYAQLGAIPKHTFAFLEPFYTDGYTREWLDSFDFRKDVWGQSNYIMNACTLLQFARDHMAEPRARAPIQEILAWLSTRQRSDTGMWHDYDDLSRYPQIGDAVRGAYHFYPLMAYDDVAIQYPESIIDTILHSQNSWGGFNPDEMASGACEDIDAIDPLLRCSVLSTHRRGEVEMAARRARLWVLSCRGASGGYESIPENACPYGGHSATTSSPGESNMFATWFRTLCLAYLTEFLSIPHGFVVGKYPGYEIRLKP